MARMSVEVGELAGKVVPVTIVELLEALDDGVTGKGREQAPQSLTSLMLKSLSTSPTVLDWHLSLGREAFVERTWKWKESDLAPPLCANCEN